MAVTAEVEIMNGALIKVGAEVITTPTDSNNRARLVNARYPHVRDAMLASHPWRFCTKYADLAQVTPKPPEVFDYSYLFEIPADCCRVIENDLEGDDWEQISDNQLACNVSEVNIKYVKRVTDVSKYPDYFIKALEWALAEDIAYALTQSQARVDGAAKGLKMALQEARSFSAQTGSTKQVEAGEWVNARR